VKLLLTGASGFVGRNVLQRAPSDWRIVALYSSDESFPAFVDTLPGDAVVAVRCDLANPADVTALVEKHGAEWDGCLYLAGKVDIPWSVRAPKEDLGEHRAINQSVGGIHVDNSTLLPALLRWAGAE
jgi:nucleoside-diphosphate-sugar epimerase